MVEVRAITEGDIAGFSAAVDVVAREKRFLAAVEGPPLTQSAAFVRDNLTKGNPQFVACDAGGIVGWCDIVRRDHQIIYLHSGTLGMGVLPAWRGQGIGRRLIDAALAAAFERGLTRIILTVRADNEPALCLYKAAGFEVEGYHRRSDRIDDRYFDTYSMALIA